MTRKLLEAYDKTSPYCMTLQEFVNFDKYVRASRLENRTLCGALRPEGAEVSGGAEYLSPHWAAGGEDAQTIINCWLRDEYD